MTNRLDHDGILDLVRRGLVEIPPRVRRALKRYGAKHLAADAQWLADLLHAKAEQGDRRARRLFSKLVVRLASYGASVKPPSWPPLTSPERRVELAAILAESSS